MSVSGVAPVAGGVVDNIHVAIRARPLNDRETSSGQSSAWVIANNSLYIPHPVDGKPVPGSNYVFGGREQWTWREPDPDPGTADPEPLSPQTRYSTTNHSTQTFTMISQRISSCRLSRASTVRDREQRLEKRGLELALMLPSRPSTQEPYLPTARHRPVKHSR